MLVPNIVDCTGSPVRHRTTGIVFVYRVDYLFI